VICREKTHVHTVIHRWGKPSARASPKRPAVCVLGRPCDCGNRTLQNPRLYSSGSRPEHLLHSISSPTWSAPISPTCVAESAGTASGRGWPHAPGGRSWSAAGRGAASACRP